MTFQTLQALKFAYMAVTGNLKMHGYKQIERQQVSLTLLSARHKKFVT